MGTLIWLIFTTVVGWAIGHFFFAEYVIFTTLIGLAIGLVIRFATGSSGDWGSGDWGGSDGGGSDGGGGGD